MRKQLMTLALALCLLGTLLPTAVFATEGGTCADGHNYSDGKCVDCGQAQEGLAAPVVVVEDKGNGKYVLDWDRVEGAARYEVYRSANGTKYTLWSWMDSNKTSFTPFSSEAGGLYYYKVVAYDKDDVPSAYSNVVQILLQLAQPQVTVTNVKSTGLIQISWEPIKGAVEYKVYRSLTGKDGSWSRISTTTRTTVTNTKNMVPGVKYYYKVIAIAQNPEGNSLYSARKSRTCDLPQPVVTVAYDAAKNGVKISWQPIEGAVSYKVYRSLTGQDGSWSRISTTTRTAVTNTKNVSPSQKYYYKVIAVAENTDANSAYSEVKSCIGKLAQPEVTLSNIESSGKIKVSWKAVEDAVSYKVYRATSKSGKYSLLITTKNTSINNTSTTAGKTYYYKVMAVAEDPSANSAYSAVQSCVCDLPRPTVTKGLNTKGQPKLTWKAVDGAVRYKVYRATTKDGTYKLMQTTTGTTYANSTMTTYETYYYRVEAVASNSSANSAKSVAQGISSTSVNITPSKLQKAFVNRINEYRAYFDIDELQWHKDGELACRTRAAEYRIDFDSNRPDGRSAEKMLAASQVVIELGFQANATAEDVVDSLMYYEEFEDYAAILMYEDWNYAVVASNNGYWCIMLG